MTRVVVDYHRTNRMAGAAGLPGQKDMTGQVRKWRNCVCKMRTLPVSINCTICKLIVKELAGQTGTKVVQAILNTCHWTRVFIPISGAQHRGLMYGAEYDTYTDSNSHLHGRHFHNLPCAIRYITQHSTVYMFPAKYTCPSGWTSQYYAWP